jgi:hypothetical protein
MPSYSRHSCQWWACSAQHRVMLSLQLRAFLSSPPPALASVSFAAQSAHCSPASRTPRRPTAPRPPNRPALLAFPPPLPTSARASTKQSTPGPRPRNRSLSGASRSPGRRRPVGTPSVPTRARSPSLATSLPHLHHVVLIEEALARSRLQLAPKWYTTFVHYFRTRPAMLQNPPVLKTSKKGLPRALCFQVA